MFHKDKLKFVKVKIIYELAYEILVLITVSSYKGSRESVQMCRLTIAFAAGNHAIWM